MDLSRILRRINNNLYSCAQECIDDVNTMFNNCFIFNKPGTLLVHLAVQLSKFFHTLLKGMPPNEYKLLDTDDTDDFKVEPSSSGSHQLLPDVINRSSSNHSTSSDTRATRVVNLKRKNEGTTVTLMNDGTALPKKRRNEVTNSQASISLSNDFSSCWKILDILTSTRYSVSCVCKIYSMLIPSVEISRKNVRD